MTYVPMFSSVKVAGVLIFVTTKSGESPNSPKSLLIDATPGARTTGVILDEVGVGAEAVPPVLPGVVIQANWATHQI